MWISGLSAWRFFDVYKRQILQCNLGIIDALQGLVPAVKPQCAYYEAFGWQGMRALAETIAYARQKGMYVITDGKRNDIGTTMEAYAAAHLGQTFVAVSYTHLDVYKRQRIGDLILKKVREIFQVNTALYRIHDGTGTVNMKLFRNGGILYRTDHFRKLSYTGRLH